MNLSLWPPEFREGLILVQADIQLISASGHDLCGDGPGLMAWKTLELTDTEGGTCSVLTKLYSTPSCPHALLLGCSVVQNSALRVRFSSPRVREQDDRVQLVRSALDGRLGVQFFGMHRVPYVTALHARVGVPVGPAGRRLGVGSRSTVVEHDLESTTAPAVQVAAIRESLTLRAKGTTRIPPFGMQEVMTTTTRLVVGEQ